MIRSKEFIMIQLIIREHMEPIKICNNFVYVFKDFALPMLIIGLGEMLASELDLI